MVGHQAVGEYRPGVAFSGVAQELEEPFVVDVVAVDRLAFVAARDDVVDAVGDLDPGWAGHQPDGSDHPRAVRVLWNDRHTPDTILGRGVERGRPDPGCRCR